MRINKNMEIGIPENMRVIKDRNFFLVQTQRDDGKWISQKSYDNAERAIADCYQWYCRDFMV